MTETKVLLMLVTAAGVGTVFSISAALVFLWDIHRKGPVYRWLKRMDVYWERFDIL